MALGLTARLLSTPNQPYQETKGFLTTQVGYKQKYVREKWRLWNANRVSQFLRIKKIWGGRVTFMEERKR